MTSPGVFHAQAPRKQAGGVNARHLFAAALAVGLAFRLFQYATGRSLWMDEAILAQHLVESSPLEVLRPGPGGAVAPGFLLATKLAVMALGPDEYALRLIPLLSGIVALVLLIPAARRYLSPLGALIAVALFAVAPYATYYAAELKQYSTDAAVTTALLLWGSTLHAERITSRRATLLALAGPACAFFSLPSLFVLGGILIALLVAAVKERRRAEVHALAFVGVFWTVLLGIPALFLLQRITAGGFAQGFWQAGFMPLPPRSLTEALWLPRALLRVFREPLGLMEYSGAALNWVQIATGLIATVLGAVWMWRRARIRLALLILPIILALAASALRVYPFGGDRPLSGRVLLFLAPVLFLLMAEGIAQLSHRRQIAVRSLGLVLLLGTVVPPFLEGATRIPYGRNEVKPLLAYLQEHRRPGDLLYVHYDAKPAFRFYRERYGVRQGEYMLGICSRLNPIEYLNALSRLRGRPRVWFLFVSGTGGLGFSEMVPMVSFLEHFGTRLDDRISVGATLFLYDLREKVPAAPEYRVSFPRAPPSVSNDCEFFDSI